MRRVAVVEDNPDNRLLVRAILEEKYNLCEYASGREAIAKAPRDLPELILLDISLPEMDGTEVLERLRAFRALEKVPVVALTAHAMVGDRERFLAAGFDDYIPKPILDPTHLVGVIESLLAGAG
ncbi:MAG: response regulator [Acidobacteriota bacterium]|nr:response regulator [Acidobacteriota bacterium]